MEKKLSSLILLFLMSYHSQGSQGSYKSNNNLEKEGKNSQGISKLKTNL